MKRFALREEKENGSIAKKKEKWIRTWSEKEGDATGGGVEVAERRESLDFPPRRLLVLTVFRHIYEP